MTHRTTAPGCCAALAVGALFVLGACARGDGTQSDGLDPAAAADGLDPERVAHSVHLGQIYPSGRLYLEAFGETADDAWSEEVQFLALDQEAVAAPDLAPGRAGFAGTEGHLNPPELEGMLARDSPCVSQGYEPREAVEYVGGRAPGSIPLVWNPAEYFATSEWFGCAAEPSLGIYETDEPPVHSFRILAVGPDLALEGVDREPAGTPRPMTDAEAARVADERTSYEGCTLQPRYRDAAEVLLTFELRDGPYRGRISSYVSACTSMAEVFLLDVLDGGQLAATFELTRWRGNP